MNISEVFTNDEAKSSFLSSSRKEMYDALALFYTHVKHTISLMLTLMTAVFAIFGLALKEGNANPALLLIFKTVGGLILIALFPLGIVSIFIIGRYYKLYVAALIYATELHKSVGLHNHKWFQHLAEDLQSLPEGCSEEDLYRKRTYGWPHSWILYTLLISALSAISMFSGIFVFTKI